MKKIAFHFHNDGVPDIDLSNVTKGNPGVGGTVFLAVLIPTLLANRQKITPLLLSNKKCIIPNQLENVVCNDLYGALDYCRAHKDVDAIVVDSLRIDIGIIKEYEDVNIVLWANNPMKAQYLKNLTYLKNVKRIINVSKEQCDLARDMLVFRKCTYIFNAFPMEVVLKYRNLSKPTSQRKHYVVYIASILPPKGFHLLAKVWPKIIEKVPDAELFVIGSGKLYDKQTKMGKWGISIPEYEDYFMRFLSKNGSILPSVHFLGEMGNEKYEVLSKCKVGVPNPSGITETFGYTAIEMQAMGCLVTTQKCPGYIDTVFDKSQLYNNPKELCNKIINLLNKTENQSEKILPWIIENFDCETVAQRWEDVLNSDMDLDIIPDEIAKTDLNFHFKRVKEFIRIYIPDRIKDYLMPLERIFAFIDGHFVYGKF